MSLVLLKIGTVLVPFYELLVRCLPMASVNAPDTRLAKLFVGLWLAIAIGLSSLFVGGFRECKNKWLLLFIFFLPLSISLSPKFPFVINGIDSTNYWVWKPFVSILCYFLMFMAVQSMDITSRSIVGIMNAMVWCGVVMSCYVFLQVLGLEQFYIVRDGPSFWKVTGRSVVGNLGQSTIVSAYLAMLVQLALYLRRYIGVIVLVCAVLLTQSVMAIGAMIVSVMIYFIMRYRVKAILPIIVALGILISFSVCSDKHIFSDNGRVGVWKGCVDAVRSGEFLGKGGNAFPYTGIGLGSYPIVVRPLLKTDFAQVHNDYLELLLTTGLFGLVLFLGSIFYMLKSAFLTYMKQINRNEISALLSSFICIAIIAFGSFVWQLSPHNFYTVIVVGLLSNHKLLKEELI